MTKWETEREREGLGLMFASFVDRSITPLVLSYNLRTTEFSRLVGLIKGLGAPVNLFQHPSFEELFFLKHRPQERRETITGSSSQLANEKRPCQTHVTPKSFINSLVTSERDFL